MARAKDVIRLAQKMHEQALAVREIATAKVEGREPHPAIMKPQMYG